MRTKQELVNAIYNFVANNELTTRKIIARELKYRAKSPHIISMIEELVKEGYLIRTEARTANNLPVYRYYINLVRLEELESKKEPNSL
jgi:Mn-dependent DtxR family transcriptional regulator